MKNGKLHQKTLKIIINIWHFMYHKKNKNKILQFNEICTNLRKILEEKEILIQENN